MDNILYINTDGSGPRGKDKPAGLAFVISRNDNVLYSYRETLEPSAFEDNKTTNYRAEVYALLRSLEHIKENNIIEKIIIRCDSEQVVKMVNSRYESLRKNNFLTPNGKTPKCINLYHDIMKIIEKYNIEVIHVKREFNKLADKYSKLNRV